MQLKYPRIVFFDMEGTLLRTAYHLDDGKVAPSAWTVLAEKLGPDCLKAENESKDIYLAGGYAGGYLEWMLKTVLFHQQFRLTESVFRELIESATFMANADIALKCIHEWGCVTVLITGGFKALADRVQRQLRLHHAFAGCEYFFHPETGEVEHVNLLPADEKGKADFMRLMCREYGYDPRECAFVGDGKNDVHLAREVGYSIAFNAQPELARVASFRISQPRGEEDFMAVADAIAAAFA
jgi:phosphoserine phosphatase